MVLISRIEGVAGSRKRCTVQVAAVVMQIVAVKYSARGDLEIVNVVNVASVAGVVGVVDVVGVMAVVDVADDVAGEAGVEELGRVKVVAQPSFGI